MNRIAAALILAVLVAPAARAELEDAQVTKALLEVIAKLAEDRFCTAKSGKKPCIMNKGGHPDQCLQHAEVYAQALLEDLKLADKEQRRKLHDTMPADATFRGCAIMELEAAAKSGRLRPGTLIHTKSHWDHPHPYEPVSDAHHWVMYVGIEPESGQPRFIDNLKHSLYATTCPNKKAVASAWDCTMTTKQYEHEIHNWKNASDHGLPPPKGKCADCAGKPWYFPTHITSFHDPLAGKRSPAPSTEVAECSKKAMAKAGHKRHPSHAKE